MKRGFTLIEMLIVVALIATLMSIVLKLSSVGADEDARNATVVRLSKLENCLSGYYAAYGCYPPVPLHNSRSIYEGVNQFGVQSIQAKRDAVLSDAELWDWDVKKFKQNGAAPGESEAWRQVRAACESQPVALESPDPDIKDLSRSFSDLQKYLREKGAISQSSEDYEKWNIDFLPFYDNINGVDNVRSWRKAPVFKFGLLSFLLPRFQAMMGWPANDMFDGEGGCLFEQWSANNGSAPHDPLEGSVDTWKDINEKVRSMNGRNGSGSAKDARAYLEALPSESVTARWLSNLEGACACDYPDRKFFGVTINDGRYGGLFCTDGSAITSLCIYPRRGNANNCYHLNRISVTDGWKTDFFYYSPSPHQSYRLWSAGKNKRTFPPWISRGSLDSKALEHVAAWTEDDIGGMSN